MSCSGQGLQDDIERPFKDDGQRSLEARLGTGKVGSRNSFANTFSPDPYRVHILVFIRWMIHMTSATKSRNRATQSPRSAGDMNEWNGASQSWSNLRLWDESITDVAMWPCSERLWQFPQQTQGVHHNSSSRNNKVQLRRTRTVCLYGCCTYNDPLCLFAPAPEARSNRGIPRDGDGGSRCQEGASLHAATPCIYLGVSGVDPPECPFILGRADLLEACALSLIS